jgi:hypothetical protein
MAMKQLSWVLYNPFQPVLQYVSPGFAAVAQAGPREEHPGPPVAMAGEDQGASPEAKVKTKEPPAETMDDLAMETKRTEKKGEGLGSQWFTWGETHKKLGLKELRKRYGDLAIQNLVNID